MIRKYLTCFTPRLPRALVYMLQASEYDLADYFAWFWRAPNLGKVARRGQLRLTAKARGLLLVAWLLVALLTADLAGAVWLAFMEPVYWIFAAGIVLAGPLALAYGLGAVSWLGELIIQRPRERAIIAQAAAVLAHHPGQRIAIAGSYGKTSMKEILSTTLAAGRVVAATPGNMNTPIGISRFVQTLSGDEDILIFELGEYYPGDITALCEFVKPHLGVITGVNEAHLSKFKTLDKTAATIFELADYLKHGPVYKNAGNELVKNLAASGDQLLYSSAGVNGWKVADPDIGLDGTGFTARKGDTKLHVQSGLLGAHQIGPLITAIDIATFYGLKPGQIEKGIAASKPFEHRMQPRQTGGAWIVDDTYNGNPDGVAAGLDWLAAVPAKRRIYVTPGLVEQGDSNQKVHEAIGHQIAKVADVVVLMKNSTTPYIETGLREAEFKGELKVVTDPLGFYQNVDQFVAAGDVMLMQNDWSDNYS